ncbi:MAG TPA: Ku protein [Candidatus Thermoplasmatota archaeon]|nr:Ku protein [Candidatus Thermoplasmatota archaeon]
MPQTVWKGSVGFGLVSLPVRMHTSTRPKGVSFRLLHAEDHAPVKNRRVCSADGKALESEEIVRGADLGGGRYVELTDEELEAITPASSSLIDVREFVDAGAIDPVYHERTYVLTPQAGGEKVYELLRRVLARENRAAIGLATLREREHLIAIRATEDGLFADILRFADEVADLPKVESQAEISDEEEELAEMIVGRMTKGFDPSKYKDSYESRVRSLIDAKISGGAVPVEAAPAAPRPTADLVAALRETLASAESGEHARSVH